MKILLAAINAKYIHSNLAVYSLRAYGRKYRDQIRIVEYTINNYSEDILKGIYKEKPDVIAFSCYIWNISLVDEVAGELRKVLPDVPVFVGGPEISYNPYQQLKEKSWLTGVMTGEGEQTFLALAEHYIEKKGSLNDIKGLFVRDGEKIIDTGRGLPLSLDTIPFPYHDMKDFENKLVYYESSRGCPFSCSYCLSSIEKGMRFRDIELVKQELQFFIDAKVPLVKFIDRTFNASHQHAMAIWQYIYEHDEGYTGFHFELAADLLKEDEIALISKFRPGLIQLEIGVQTINPLTIEAIHRKMDLKKLEYAVKEVGRNRNIKQHLDLIAGLPYEDISSFKKSFDYVYRLNPDELQLGFLKVLKGSPIYELSGPYEIAYKTMPPFEVLSTKWLSYEDILNLKKIEEMVEVYYNSGQFVNTISFLLHEFTSPYSLYEALGEYYEEKNLFGVNHTRISRYNIIRDFYEDKINRDTKAFEQLLVYDLYLRENLKSRPSFAVPLEDSKEERRFFYEQEEKLREMLPAYKQYTVKQISRMTHLEFFDFDLEKTIETGERRKGKTKVLFDYRDRDLLYNQAKTYREVLW